MNSSFVVPPVVVTSLIKGLRNFSKGRSFFLFDFREKKCKICIGLVALRQAANPPGAPSSSEVPHLNCFDIIIWDIP